MAFIINGEKVGDELIEEEFDSIKDHYINLGEVVCCDRDEEFQSYARDNVVNRTLLEQESVRKFGETSDAEVDAMLAKLKEEHGGEEEFYQNTGFNPGDEFAIRRKIRSTITVDKILEDHLGEDPDPTEDDLRAFYEEHIDRYLTEEEVRVSQIFAEPTSHEEAQSAYKELREARKRIMAGEEDFVEVARRFGPEEKQNIDMGFLKQGQTMPEVEAITFSLEDGEVSPIVATHFGFHLFRLEERKAPEPVPFDDIRDDIREQYLAHRRESRIQELIDELKAKGTIEEVEEPVEA